MTTDSGEEEDWESLASSDSDEEDGDITSTVLMNVVAAVAAAVSAACIAETSQLWSYDCDPPMWKVPKIIECKPNVNDKIDSDDFPEKASDMEQMIVPAVGTTTTSTSSLSSLSSNHRVYKRSPYEVIAKATRDLNSCLRQAQMQGLEDRRKCREMLRQYDEIQRKRQKTDQEPVYKELGIVNK